MKKLFLAVVMVFISIAGSFASGFNIHDFVLNSSDSTIINEVNSNKDLLSTVFEPNELTLLSVAVGQSRYELTHFLLEQGANQEIPDIGGCIPLKHAVETGDYKMVKLLLEFGGNPNKRDRSQPLLTYVLSRCPFYKSEESAIKILELLIPKTTLDVDDFSDMEKNVNSERDLHFKGKKSKLLAFIKEKYNQ